MKWPSSNRVHCPILTLKRSTRTWTSQNVNNDRPTASEFCGLSGSAYVQNLFFKEMWAWEAQLDCSKCVSDPLTPSLSICSCPSLRCLCWLWCVLNVNPNCLNSLWSSVVRGMVLVFIRVRFLLSNSLCRFESIKANKGAACPSWMTWAQAKTLLKALSSGAELLRLKTKEWRLPPASR